MDSIYLLIFIISLIPFSINFSIAVYTLVYHFFIYKNFIRTKFDTSFNPKCTIVIPAKGANSQLKKNLTSFLKQNYKNYQVMFTVESKSDPAVKIIKSITQKFKNSSLTIAGLSHSCCQKNKNLIAAISKIKKTDILVFADADIIVSKNWLKELILPLSDKKNTASTTWFTPSSTSGSIGELSHVFLDSFTYTAFCYASSIYKSSLLWGGSIAIRYKDFKNLKVTKAWSNHVVDDTSLSKILKDNKHRTVMVPSTLCQSQSSLQTIQKSSNWYVRQIMYLKLYRRQLWLTVLFFNFFIYTFIYFWLPVTAFTDQPTYYFLIPVVYVFGEMYTAYLYLYFAPIKSPLKFVFLAPFFKLIQFISYGRTFFLRTIYWGGITYTIDQHGQVNNIER